MYTKEARKSAVLKMTKAMIVFTNVLAFVFIALCRPQKYRSRVMEYEITPIAFAMKKY